jgi:NAD+ kinase
MFTIAVFPNVDKENAGEVLKRIVDFCATKPMKLLLPMDEALFFGYDAYGEKDIGSCAVDMGLSIGGDGTLLGVSRQLYARNIPVCGINIGTFGFLADIELPELESKLEKILRGEYRIEERMVLSGFVQSDGRERFLANAINDVVITKGGVARMLHLSLSIDGFEVADYKADGVIVSTSTGSTAYSLSAGGPIINPKIKALLLTPICPHTFDVRPMVIGEDEEVHIHIAATHQDIIVTFDGQESFRLLPGDEVFVRKAPEPAKIVKFEDKNYYQTLRTKLWKND